MDSYSITNGGLGAEEYYERKQQQEQFEEKQKLEQQKVDIQQKQLEVQQNQQSTNTLLVTGGLSATATLLLVLTIYLIVRSFKRARFSHNKS